MCLGDCPQASDGGSDFAHGNSIPETHSHDRLSPYPQRKNQGAETELVFIEAEIYNAQDEVCTKAVCTYFIFPREKAEKEMYFKGCYTEKEKESL